MPDCNETLTDYCTRKFDWLFSASGLVLLFMRLPKMPETAVMDLLVFNMISRSLDNDHQALHVLLYRSRSVQLENDKLIDR